MVKIDFTGAGQYWLSCPEPTDGNGGVADGGALWIDLAECETEADLLAAVLTAVNEYTEATRAAGESCWDGWTAAEVGGTAGSNPVLSTIQSFYFRTFWRIAHNPRVRAQYAIAHGPGEPLLWRAVDCASVR
jgi:hypothetical protein